MESDQDGPVNLALKLSFQDARHLVYNLDLAKSKNLIFGGICLGLIPMHAGCLFAFDTCRNCIEKEETKFTAGVIASPGKTQPWSSPLAFQVFNFLGYQHRQPGLDLSVSATKKLDNTLYGGVAVGLDSREGGGVSFAGFASCNCDDDTSFSVFANRHLNVGLGVTRHLNAYHSVSLLALIDPVHGPSFGFTVDYRPDPPLMMRIRFKMKEWRRDGVKLGGSGGASFETDPDIEALQQKLEGEAKRTMDAAKKSWEEARKSLNEFLNRN